MPERYRFQQKRLVSPLSGRGVALREQELQMREAIAYGKQELEAYKAARQMIQDTLKIKQALVKEKQVAAATTAVGKLNPLSENWLQEYSQIMASNPYAHDNPTLTVLFHQQAKVYNAHLSAQIHREATDYTSQKRRSDEDYKARLDIESDFQKQKTGEAARLHNELIAKAIKDGVDISKFTTFDENGEPAEMKWAELSQAAAKAKSGVPNESAIKSFAELVGKQTAMKTRIESLRKSPLTGYTDETTGKVLPVDLAAKERDRQIAALEDDQYDAKSLQSSPGLKNIEAQLAVFKSSYPQLGGGDSRPSPEQQAPTQPSPAATPQPAAPLPSATPDSRPPLDDIFK